MPTINLKLSPAGEPILAQWVSQKAGNFQVSLSDGRVVQGRLVWLDSQSGLLILGNKNSTDEGGPVHPFYRVEESANALSIWLAGKLFVIERLSREPRRAGALAPRSEMSDGKLRAPLPGRVLRVLVAVGDRVEAATPLLILESMKMETTLLAPIAGEVCDILTAPEALVDKGAVLLSIDSQEAMPYD